MIKNNRKKQRVRRTVEVRITQNLYGSAVFIKKRHFKFLEKAKGNSTNFALVLNATCD